MVVYTAVDTDLGLDRRMVLGLAADLAAGCTVVDWATEAAWGTEAATELVTGRRRPSLRQVLPQQPELVHAQYGGDMIPCHSHCC